MYRVETFDNMHCPDNYATLGEAIRCVRESMSNPDDVAYILDMGGEGETVVIIHEGKVFRPVSTSPDVLQACEELLVRLDALEPNKVDSEVRQYARLAIAAAKEMK